MASNRSKDSKARRTGRDRKRAAAVPRAKPAGRTKLTSQVEERIMAALEDGLSLSRAGLLAGVSTGTISHWRAVKPEFAEAIERARARGIERRLREIDGAVRADGSPDWRAKAWILSKIAPEEYGEKVQHRHGGEVKLSIPAEILKRIQERRRAALALAERP